jgi:hypothetical protein
VENEHHHCNHNKDVNETAGDMKGKAADPEQQEKDRNNKEHTGISRLGVQARVT